MYKHTKIGIQKDRETKRQTDKQKAIEGKKQWADRQNTKTDKHKNSQTDLGKMVGDYKVNNMYTLVDS